MNPPAIPIRILLWGYFPFLVLLWLGIGFAEFFLLAKKLFILLPVLFFMILLAIPFAQIAWACRCFFWDLEEDEGEIRLPRDKMRALVQFVNDVADERQLPVPDRIRFHPDTVAHVYRNSKGQRILVLGGLAMRCFSQKTLAGIVAHELGHFQAGDTDLAWRCQRRVLFMRVLEGNLVLVIKPNGPVRFGSWLVQVNPAFWVLMNILNPVPWLIVAYHRLFALIYASHSRRQEFAADRLSVEQSGQAAARSLVFMDVLEHTPWANLTAIAESYLETNTPIGQVFSEQVARAARIDEREWERACRNALAARTGWFDSHPCLKERLAALGITAKKALEMRPDRSGSPATALVENWEAVEDRLTGQLMARLHQRYQLDEDVAQVAEHLARKQKK